MGEQKSKQKQILNQVKMKINSSTKSSFLVQEAVFTFYPAEEMWSDFVFDFLVKNCLFCLAVSMTTRCQCGEIRRIITLLLDRNWVI